VLVEPLLALLVPLLSLCLSGGVKVHFVLEQSPCNRIRCPGEL
jgi:hypothetical protein